MWKVICLKFKVKFKRTVCVWIDHSRIQRESWGYWYCARCNTLIGDAREGYPGHTRDVYKVGCGCMECIHFKLDWRDKFLVNKYAN